MADGVPDGFGSTQILHIHPIYIQLLSLRPLFHTQLNQPGAMLMSK
jgi:hypothetical protein